jgi:hypothetical protein
VLDRHGGKLRQIEMSGTEVDASIVMGLGLEMMSRLRGDLPYRATSGHCSAIVAVYGHRYRLEHRLGRAVRLHAGLRDLTNEGLPVFQGVMRPHRRGDRRELF